MEAPTISDVLTGFKAGTYTLAKAQELIGVHVSASADLNTFAGLAMQTLLADPQFVRKAMNDRDYPTAVAREAYRVANAMMTAST